MKLNKIQKRTLLIGLLSIFLVFIVWSGYGFEIFTKSEVLIEKEDALLGIVHKEWKEQFVLGLDYTLGLSAVITFFAILLMWLKRDKNK